MATTVVMEALSPTMEEGRLVEWKKQPGDAVAVGDVLAEVETDKAVMELLARAAGTLLVHHVPAGTTLPVGEAVAVIGEAGEVPDGRSGGRADGEIVAGAGAGAPAPPSRPSADPPSRPAAPARLKASPLALRLAAEQGIDLTTVTGTGPDGRIVQRDVAGAARGTAPAPPSLPSPAGPSAPLTVAPPAPRPAAMAESATAYTEAPLTPMRKAIAKRLVQSLGPVPTFYLTVEADMERVLEAREALNAATGGPKVSVNDIVLKAVATALREHPACNAWWQDDRIRTWHPVHLGVAVATDDGLLTPVIRDAHAKGLRHIAAEVATLVERARARRLQPEEYTGATFTVSNLGMLGVDEFTAIINPPEAAILAVGRIAAAPVAHAGTVTVRRRMRLTLSCDHRVIDGAVGARFLQTLVRLLENPLAFAW